MATLYLAVYATPAGSPTWDRSTGWSGSPVYTDADTAPSAPATHTFSPDVSGLSPSTEYAVYVIWDDGATTVGPVSTAVTTGAGAAELAGTAIGVTVASGSLVTSVQLIGSGESALANNGTLTAKIVFSGAALVHVAATAALTPGAGSLAADAGAAADAAAALTTDVVLAGMPVALARAGAALTGQIALAGAALASAVTSATLVSSSVGLVAHAGAVTDATAALATDIVLAGAPVASARTDAALATQITLGGAASESVEASAALTSMAADLAAHVWAAAASRGALASEIWLNGAAGAMSWGGGALAGGVPTMPPSHRVLSLTYPSRTLRLRYPSRVLRVCA